MLPVIADMVPVTKEYFVLGRPPTHSLLRSSRFQRDLYSEMLYLISDEAYCSEYY
jgi:hypothetical protein